MKKKRTKQRRSNRKIAPNSNEALPPPMPGGKRNSGGAYALIDQLHDHVEQGRIFDAREIVDQLECSDGWKSRYQVSKSIEALSSVLHIMDEVKTQSDHVQCLLHELHSDQNWTLAKQKSGVTVHYRREPNSPIHTVRAATTFDNFAPKDFVRFCSLFVETELMHLWFPAGIMRPANLLSWHSKYSKVIQININLGFPLISPRDAIVFGNGYHLPDRNAMLISTKTILDDTCRYCDIPKPAKGVVRMATESIFYIQLLKNDVISFKMIGRDDLKFKHMPSSVLNFVAQGHLPFDLMRTIHRTICNFEGSVWEEKIKERGSYYTEIEEKVYEQLDLMQIEGEMMNDRSAKLEGDGPNHVFVTGEIENPSLGRHTKTLAIMAALIAFSSVLCFMGLLPMNILLAAIVILSPLFLSLLLLMMLNPTNKTVKRPNKNFSTTEHKQSNTSQPIEEPVPARKDTDVSLASNHGIGEITKSPPLSHDCGLQKTQKSKKVRSTLHSTLKGMKRVVVRKKRKPPQKEEAHEMPVHL